MGAEKLVNDKSMYPIRGQVLRIKAPFLKSIYFFDKSYIIPNMDNVVIGGTAQEGDYSTVPSREDTKEIMNDASFLFPSLLKCRVEKEWAGLRPGRTSLRLELEDRSNQGKASIVHCYGHGGSGITLAMGCAQQVVADYVLPIVINSRNRATKLISSRL